MLEEKGGGMEIVIAEILKKSDKREERSEKG